MRAANQAGKPRSFTPSISATALWLAHVHEHAERPVAELLIRPWPSAAATFSATSLPWRSACWQVGGEGRCVPLAGSGTAAASPIAQTFVVALHAHRRVHGDPPASSSGRPELAHQRRRLDARGPAQRRAGTSSPVDSVAESSSIESSRVSVRISMPRARSSRVANSARLGGISGMIRSCASTRIQRVPSSRQRG